MKKIVSAHLKFFRNEAHYEYMVVFRTLLLRFPVVQAVIAMLYDAFAALLALEEQLTDAMKTSNYTQQIADADHRVDRDLTGLREAVASALHHFDPMMVAAAQSLHNRLKAFGDITKKSYEEETAAVNILLADLQSPEYAAKIAQLGLGAWIAELRQAEDLFEQRLDLRNTERADKPQERLRDVRRDIDVAYHAMTDRINAAVTMDAANTYDEFIRLLNTQVAYFNEHTHSPAKKDVAGVAVDAIAVQKHTGKAVIVIPTVRYTEEGKPAVELTFTKDFDLTYKNNVNAGTADIIIHGKGAYKGQKTVTFSIEN